MWGSCNQMLWHVGVCRIREKNCLIFSSLSYPYINFSFNVFNIGVVFTNQFYVHSKFIFLPNSLLLLYCLQRWYVYMQCTLRKVSHVIRNSRLHSNNSDIWILSMGSIFLTCSDHTAYNNKHNRAYGLEWYLVEPGSKLSYWPWLSTGATGRRR